MIWVALWVATAVFAFQGMFLSDGMGPEGAAGYFFIGLFYLFILAIAAVVFGGVGVGIGQAFPSHAEEGAHARLAVIRDKDGVEGRFFLGSGFIKSEPYYFYYETLPDGGFRPGQIQADSSVTVYEEDRQDAEVVTFDWRMHYPMWAGVICIPTCFSGTGTTHVFHVPKGTIKTEYSM